MSCGRGLSVREDGPGLQSLSLLVSLPGVCGPKEPHASMIMHILSDPINEYGVQGLGRSSVGEEFTTQA